ncbi:hypothetical protein LRS06_19410 [Hymenobacter sp. J193]|uniref:hypothetical protein n=1 Tax=Hymenobacter sp. J193 TaxID=2898429 RepID=UPI00215091C4|nr:hypothetical protein [Hymenobacter sp. J193]MCR5889900.1 hypothetical protein [Hymenobacter sp. J193]
MLNSSNDEVTKKITTATVLYYQQLDHTPPTALELVEWLEQLLPRVQSHLLSLGLRQCLSLPSFMRSVLAKRGFSMIAFMEANLLEPEFAVWMQQESNLHK